jgi:hypothetical protein
VVNLLIDLELGVGLEVFPYSGLWVIAMIPGPVREHVSGQIFNNCVKHHAVTVY